VTYQRREQVRDVILIRLHDINLVCTIHHYHCTINR